MTGPARLLTAEQVAELTQLGRTIVFAKIATGEIASVKIGRLRRVPVEAVDEYVARLVAEQAGQVA